MLGVKLARWNWWGPLLGASLFAACSSSNNDFFGAPLTAGRSSVGGAAGNAASGGAGANSASGGNGDGGASAGKPSGGSDTSGDAGTSTSGAPTTTGGTGGTTGGDAGSGGDMSTGGDAGTGGDMSTGGDAGTGGDVSTGGDAGTGGDVSGEGGTGLTDGGASGAGAGGESGAGAAGEGGTTGVGGTPSVGGMAGFGGMAGVGGSAGVGGVAGAGGSGGLGGKAGSGSGGTPPDLTCLGDGDCEPGHYCQKTVCGASVGECTKQPPNCKGPEAEFEPVCGCDGMTYYSPCVAAREGADIAASGECTTNQATCTRAAGGSSCSPAHALARCYRPRVGCSGSSATTGVCWVMPDECAPEEKVNVYCNNGGTPSCVGLCEVLKDDLAVWRDSGTCP